MAERQKEREEEEGKHYISMPSKHGMLGYFNKKPAFIQPRKEDKVKGKVAEGEKQTDKKQAEKWKVKALYSK